MEGYDFCMLYLNMEDTGAARGKTIGNFLKAEHAVWSRVSMAVIIDLTDLRFCQPCGQLKVGSRVDYGWVLNPSLVLFFTRFLVPGNGYYRNFNSYTSTDRKYRS